jgi:hypothetical protein
MAFVIMAMEHHAHKKRFPNCCLNVGRYYITVGTKVVYSV